MEFRTLRIEELDQWIDHCLYVFNGGKYSESFRQYFKNHWMNDPWRDLESIFVAVDEGKIASTVRVFRRKIYLGGQIVDMGGIGEVSTKAEYQNKGLSKKLLALAIKRMQELGIKVSILFTGHDKFGFYNKSGWQNTKRYFNVTSITAKDEFNHNIIPVNWDTDLAAVSQIHSSYSKCLSGVIVRDSKDYWKDWVTIEAKKFYVIEDNNKIIAYVDFEKNEKNIRIKEFGELESEGSLFSSLASKLAAMNNLDECEIVYSSSIKSNLVPDRINEEAYEMIRLISPFKLDNLFIESTEQLVNTVQNMTFWDIDSY